MSWFALGSCRAVAGCRPVLRTERGVFDLQELLTLQPGSLLAGLAPRGLAEILRCWTDIETDLFALATRAIDTSSKLTPLPDTASLAAPYVPPRIFAAASNYIEHANEMGTVLAQKAESAPYMFLKATSSVIGPGEAIVLPPTTAKVDWEVELAAVIGRGGKNIPVDKALEHVAGYTVFNDISARDLTRRNDFPFKFDWFQGKSFDTFGPLGPWIVPGRVIGDPQTLCMTLTVNDTLMQDDSTASMIFTVAEQVSYLSSILTLAPGDLIATGTPDGVGLGRGTFLKAGDVVSASIEKIGALTNPVTADSASAASASS